MPEEMPFEESLRRRYRGGRPPTVKTRSRPTPRPDPVVPTAHAAEPEVAAVAVATLAKAAVPEGEQRKPRDWWIFLLGTLVAIASVATTMIVTQRDTTSNTPQLCVDPRPGSRTVFDLPC